MQQVVSNPSSARTLTKESSRTQDVTWRFVRQRTPSKPYCATTTFETLNECNLTHHTHSPLPLPSSPVPPVFSPPPSQHPSGDTTTAPFSSFPLLLHYYAVAPPRNAILFSFALSYLPPSDISDLVATPPSLLFASNAFSGFIGEHVQNRLG
jgi:hypothetical protein